MEAIIWMIVGAASVVVAIGCYTASRKGWDYVRTWLKQRAAQAEAKLHADADKLDVKIKDAVHSELAKLDSEIATLKTKVGI
ncbi:MAG TPA: hypothetical protein VH397_16360 [Xanthobacteraceae bacterium]|jgi:hypothetical protein